MPKTKKLIELAEKVSASVNVSNEEIHKWATLSSSGSLLPILRAAERMAEALNKIKSNGCDPLRSDPSCPGCIAHDALAEWKKVNE